MFKIHHITNSFISIESKNSILTCDPWIGKTSDNGWCSYPIRSLKDIDQKIFKSNFIYISHLHCDHLDFKTLKKFKNKDLTFIIKKFDNGILKKRLKKLTNKKIIELKAFKKKKINKDFTIAIIPQLLSNTSNIQDDIQYDLDTSIIIQSNKDKTIFYNNVDNSLNLNILKKINIFVKKKFKKKIDVFTCGLGAASEFPQTFLNIKRKKEKDYIIKRSLREIKQYINYLRPKIYFPSGGTYTIYGKFHRLNKYVAQPNFFEITKSLKNLNVKIFNLIGGGSIDVYKSKFFFKDSKFNDEIELKNTFISKTKLLDYYYTKKNNLINIKKLNSLYEKSKINYFRILKKINLLPNWKIKFHIFKKLELNEQCLIDKKKSKIIKTYELNSKNFLKKQKFPLLECYLEYDLFESLLAGNFPWNTSLSGSTIMFKRRPNKFNSNMVFSLNFLKI
tara:strand:- start:8973 stop:10316 length:1344 start_codon:yes stop_codon:yes gene_type:complete